MNLLVTGGNGFIGSNFIRYTLKKYRNINIADLDKLTYAGNINNLKDIERDPRYKSIKGDIRNSKLVNKLLRAEGHKLDAIVNFAAETHVDRSIKNVTNFVKTNVEGVKVLLDASRKYKIKKFLQISTDEVYGDVKKGFPKETSKLSVNSPYAASKAASDLLCLSYYRTYNLPVIITRSSNNFGPYQYPEKAIPLFITNLITGKKMPIYGDGKNVRNWLYVIDNCCGIDLVLRKGKPGEIYNIGTNNQIRNIDLAKMLLKKFNLKSDYIKYVTDRPGHDRRYALNPNKIKRLGWKPEYSFDKALGLTVDWYRENEWWWKPLKRKAKIIKW